MDNFGLNSTEKTAHIQKYNRALFANMAHCTDAVWELDITRGTAFIMHDRFSPESAQKTFTLEQLNETIYERTHPDYRDSTCFMYRPEYISNLFESISFKTVSNVDGCYHTLKCVMTPLFDTAGKVISAYVTLQDIQAVVDEWNAEQESQIDASRYLSAVNCGIIHFSLHQQKVIYTNDSALKMFRYRSLEEMQATTIDMVASCVDQKDLNRLKNLIGRLKSENDGGESELHLVRRDSSQGTYRVSVRLVQNNGADAVVQLSIVDVSSLAEMRSRLEAAEHANKAKTAFMNTMSHDFRTPLNAITGYTDLIRAHYDDRERAFDYLSKISASSQHLEKLINDVLDMGLIESGLVSIEDSVVNLNDLVDDVHQMIQGSVDGRQLKLAVSRYLPDTADVWCDRQRMIRVLTGCLKNVIKGTQPGGTVDLSLTQLSDSKQKTGTYQFRIWSTGCVMPSESGLEMAVIKSILQLMHGDITVSSRNAGDTEITIIMKLRSAKPKKTVSGAPGAASADEIRGCYVLLAEDNYLNREIATVILEDAGATVDAVENGLAAVNKVSACTGRLYDFIVMDIQMPIMNGYQAAREIRNMTDPDKASIPIIAMTANALDDDKRRAHEAGMNSFIQKPIQMDTAFETITNTLRNR